MSEKGKEKANASSPRTKEEDLLDKSSKKGKIQEDDSVEDWIESDEDESHGEDGQRTPSSFKEAA